MYSCFFTEYTNTNKLQNRKNILTVLVKIIFNNSQNLLKFILIYKHKFLNCELNFLNTKRTQYAKCLMTLKYVDDASDSWPSIFSKISVMT